MKFSFKVFLMFLMINDMLFFCWLVQNDRNDQVWVHSNKQGFQDCEPYAKLEDWLGNKSDEYWDANFDALQLVLF